jgi:hypothetical protein
MLAVADSTAGDAPEPVNPLAGEGANSSSSQPPQRRLRPDLSPAQLVEFLSGADKDMQLIVTGRSGITNTQEARDTLVQIINMKLEASRRLAKHNQADEKARSEGARGQLQALSHLAALGDLKIARQLEQLAESNLDSSDPMLVADSRLVLIGFAIESLQNGEQGAADRIIKYIDQIAESDAKPDVPAMMVMGQARESLMNYGHEDQAKRVRDLIVDLFAASPEPQIAQMAAELAGNVRNDGIERLRVEIMDGNSVSTSRWREAVETLVHESADLQTVQYLAGTALELESLGLAELVEATFDVMAARFNIPGSATAQEVQLAISAHRARGEIIGQLFEDDLPQADGSPLSIADYRGKVVLMPFWTIGFPESRQLVPRLKAIVDAHPDSVAIVGMNVDAEDAPVQEFLKENDPGFPNFRAATSPTAKIANPVAAKFGLVSMPFVAILDQEGRVAAINFTGRGLEQTVEKLIAP